MQEIFKLWILEVTDAPSQEDPIVLPLPCIGLHVELIYSVDLRYSFFQRVQFLHCHRTLVEAINLSKVIFEEVS